ncbi:MAG: hypothetical protein JW730_11110 [Anaerolineales bacterium]|nr:hypothetical protein [Anaerolineales bacterium]
MNGNISTEILKRTIAYFYLLAYCPVDSITDFKDVTRPLIRQFAEDGRVREEEYLKEVIPEVSRRIVAYHEGTREPSQEYVEALIQAAGEADQSPEKVTTYQEVIARIAQLPQRAKPENRLHRKKGCSFCSLPCWYGYFTLISEPQFNVLQEMLETETRKPPAEQSPIYAVWGFALRHLHQITGSDETYIITPEHLKNMSYCLLLLAMAKSRRALPEEQLLTFQAAGRDQVQRLSVLATLSNHRSK